MHQGECLKIRSHSRPKPAVKSSQHLREMRHKVRRNEHKGVIAQCPKCNQEFTLEELLVYYLNQFDDSRTDVENWGSTVDEDGNPVTSGKNRMEELLFLLSSPESEHNQQLLSFVTNTVRNIHGDKHAPQCFTKGNECRHRLPDLPSSQTVVESTEQFGEWYDYLGIKHTYNKFDLLPARGEYDVFANQYCKAISLSKLGSNSNSQICVNGQKAIYSTKYPTKSTQYEDESEYEKVLYYTTSRLTERRFDLDFSEALSRTIGASLAHSSSNVISAWLAKYLVNQGSQFQFSHEFRTVPHFSLQEEMMKGHGLGRKIKNYHDKSYIDSTPLQYLYRPASGNAQTLKTGMYSCLFFDFKIP